MVKKAKTLKDWPREVRDVTYHSTADDSAQPALTYSPAGTDKRPLLVALHTWSRHYKQGGAEVPYAKWCIQNDWHFIHPDFRGPNWAPDAMGSELVVKDIVSSVEYMKKNHTVDTDRIYLIGVSGGGHCAMLMAGRNPEIWAGVSVWCGISDINKWWRQCSEGGAKRYAEFIEKCCGGSPVADPKIAEDCKRRSPITWLKHAKIVPLDINHGINDGRKGSVPFSQSLYAFNEVAEGKDTLTTETIELFYKTRDAPQSVNLDDPLYGKRKPLFRKQSGNARVTIFDGGHQIVHLAALNWLAKQSKSQRTSWVITDPISLKTSDQEADSGK